MLARNGRKTQNPVLLMIIFAILNGHRNGNDIPYKQFCWTSMLPVLAVGRNWMWVRYSPTNYTNWFGEITWCNMFPMFSYVFPMAQCFQSPDGKSLIFPGKVIEAWESSGWFIQQGPFNKWGTGDIPSSWYEIPRNLNKHGTEKKHIQPPHPISSNSTKRRPPHVICLRTSIHHYISRTINSTIIQHHPVLPKKMPRNFQKISTKHRKIQPPKQLTSANLAPFSSNQSCSDFSSTNFCLGVAMATKAVRQGSMAPKPLASKQPVFAWGSGRFPGISWWLHEISWGCNQCNHSKTGDFSPTTAKYASFLWKMDDSAMKT